MATTTNYGWTTPDDTALVKDGASAIRSLGTSVDTTTKNLNPSTTLGDIEYRSSTANTNTRLGIGSTGNVLTVAGGVPTWAAPAGSSKVVQIVSAKYSTDASTTSSTFSDTGLTATITPTSASNKVLVFLNMAGVAKAVSDTSVNIRLVRDSTTISANFSNGGTGSTAANFIGGVSTSILDTPATTSATIYKATFASSNNTGNAYVQLNASESTITLMEVTP